MSAAEMRLLYFMFLSVFGAEIGGIPSCVLDDQNPTYNGKKCASDEFIALKVELSNSKKNMCTDLFASDKTAMGKWTKNVYMEAIRAPYNGLNQTFDLGDFNVTVVRVTCVDLRRMQTCDFQDDFEPILQFELFCNETVPVSITFELIDWDCYTADKICTDSKTHSTDEFIAMHLVSTSESDHHNPRILSFISYIANTTENSLFFNGQLNTTLFAIKNISGVKNVIKLQGQTSSWLVFQIDKENIVPICTSDEMNAFISDMDAIKITENQMKKLCTLYASTRGEDVFMMSLEFGASNITCEYMNAEGKGDAMQNTNVSAPQNFEAQTQQQQRNEGCVSNRVNSDTNFFVYNNTGLQIAENLSTVVCKWNGSQCYVQCSTVNAKINITGFINASFIEKASSNYQYKIFLFNISDQAITCNVTVCDVNLISRLIEVSSSSGDWNHLTQVNNMCTQLWDSSTSIKESLIGAEKKYIDYLANEKFTASTKNYNLEDFNMTVVNMNMMNTTDQGQVIISAPKVPKADDVALNVFVPIEPFLNVTEEQHKISIVTYPPSLQFVSNSSIVLKSNVIRVEASNLMVKDLSNLLVINFKINSSNIMNENQTLSCKFYNDTVGVWENSGSFTNLENFYINNTVSCSYDHMTPFAVLLVNRKQIDPYNWKILSNLTYIGCSISSFFSAVTTFLYVFMKRSKKDNSLQIHVSLNVAVFFLNTSFLFTEWGATYDKSVCVIIAVIIQYSLLSCFSWMLIEALHLYLKLIKVYNIYIRRYLFKLSLFGWGVPAVLVGGSLCVFNRTPFYGLNDFKLPDTNKTTSFCWITDTRFLYGMNISYFSLTFLFNTSVLVAVIYQVFKLRRSNNIGKRLPSRKDICTVLGLTFLLGMTWGLIFFTSGYTNYPILYLFCICNSLQGLFLFLWICSAMKKRSHQMSETMPATVTTNIYEANFSN